jgi:transposase InsO family protein
VYVTGITTNPVGEWVTQQARNLSFDLAEQGRQAKFLIRDRDAKFTASFDEVFAPEGIRNIATPIRSPRANASAARFIGTVRRECLDRLLVFHRAQFETVLSQFFDHYNGHRPHRSLGQQVPRAVGGKPLRISHPDPAQLRRSDKLGGLVHEYRLVA